MTTLYVDNIAPNLQSSVAIPGHVIQVVQSTYATQGNTTSTSGTDVGLSASITPSSSSNKILVSVNGGTTWSSAPGNGSGPSFWLADGSDNSITDFSLNPGGFGTTGTSYFPGPSVNFLHSPSTTSAFTYKLKAKTYNSGVQTGWCWNNTEMTMTLMEIAG